ncbi:MAG: hypothetical protein NTU76_04815 [Candidatus Taylorbacteria bacterium]|nr:hypothetical protein [Candidatus Taylorbacteria bacterium]
MAKPCFHASFKSVLNIMTGKNVFDDEGTKKEVQQIVQEMTGLSPDNPLFVSKMSLVRESFCKRFREIWDNTRRAQVTSFARSLERYARGSEDYCRVVDNWLLNMQANGFRDLVLEPFEDGSEVHREIKVRVRHHDGITKHKQVLPAA